MTRAERGFMKLGISIVLILGGVSGYLTVSSVVEAASARPKFKAGDCVQDNQRKERWETPEPIFKVLEVGKLKYKIVQWDSENKKYDEVWESMPIILLDDSDKVKCPR
jgi:hypothetical protein